MALGDKRVLEDNAEDPKPKRRSRWDTGDESGQAAPPPAPTSAPPVADMAAAIAAAKASARLALERARAGIAGALPKPAVRAEAVHASLILDSDGRLVDSASGRVVNDSRGPTATAKANMAAAGQRFNPYLAHTAAVPSAAAASASAEEAGGRSNRGRRGLVFLKQGEISARAQEQRAQVSLDALYTRAAEMGASAAARAPTAGPVAAGGAASASGAAGQGPGHAAEGTLAEGAASSVQLPPGYAAAARNAAQLQPVPRVEWWDAVLLRRGPLPGASRGRAAAAAQDRAGVEGAAAASAEPALDEPTPLPQYALGLDPDRVTAYVEHPPPVEPPAEPAPPPPQPLPLTQKERKKLRTQRRQALERAKQDQIRAGLAPPPPPKVKLSNIMRALGEQAVANPTAVEARVKAQVAAREAAHEGRNAGAKLSKEQTREKRLAKAAADVAAGVHVAVYRVSAVATRQQLHKVELNATQLHFSGVCLLTHDALLPPVLRSSAPTLAPGTCSSVIVAEGGAKAHRAYAKLLLRRIRWDEGVADAEAEGAGGMGAGLRSAARVRPECRLVWRGLVARAYFKSFKVEQCKSADLARKFLGDRGFAHYWDAAVSFNAEGQGLVDALEGEETFMRAESWPTVGAGEAEGGPRPMDTANDDA